GDSALMNNPTGGSNTAIGSKSMLNNTMASYSTAIGAGTSITGNHYIATAVGAYADANCDFCVVLGNWSTNTGVGISTPSARLSVSVNGTDVSGTAMSTAVRINSGDLG